MIANTSVSVTSYTNNTFEISTVNNNQIFVAIMFIP